MNRSILILFFFAFFDNSFAQNEKPRDTLFKQFLTLTNDTQKISFLLDITRNSDDIEGVNKTIQEAISLSLINKSDSITSNRLANNFKYRFNIAKADSQKAMYLYALANVITDTLESTRYFHQGIALSRRCNYSTGLAFGLRNYGIMTKVWYGNARYSEAIALYDSALNVASRAGNKIEMGYCYHWLGEIYKIKSDYSKALEHYNQGNEIAEELNDSYLLMLNYHDLGWMRINMKGDTSAAYYLSKGLAYARDIGEPFWIADMALHMGELYWKTGKYDLSIKHSTEALNLFRLRKDTLHISVALNQLGLVREAQKRFEEAENYFRQGAFLNYASFNERYKLDSITRAPIISGIGDALFGQNKYHEALYYYKEAEKWMKGVPLNQWVRDNFEGLAKTYFALGDFKKAYHYHQLFKQASDSVEQLESADRLAQTQAIYDFDKIKSEQEKNDAIQLAELSKQKQQKYYFIAGTALLIIVAGFILVRLQLVRKTKKQLEAKNKEIEAAKERAEQLVDEKEMLMKEIHHRVKNNLEVISSLLELQSEGIDDSKAKAAVIEGQSRVQSIVLIHHKLYRTDDVSSVEFKSFANDLYKQVASVFKKAGTEVDFKIIADETQIPIDSAVPIGLILNELLTNTFKYAISADKTNEIRLHLVPAATTSFGKIIYSDNGPGMPEGYDINKSSSLGMRVIQLLTKQLGGTLHFYNDNGGRFEIPFKLN